MIRYFSVICTGMSVSEQERIIIFYQIILLLVFMDEISNYTIGDKFIIILLWLEYFIRKQWLLSDLIIN